MTAEQELPLFAGLNDKTITDIPAYRRQTTLHDQRRAHGGQSGQMGRTAAAADPDRRTRGDRMPGQDPCHRRLRAASCRWQFSSGVRFQDRAMVAEGALPDSVQSRCRRFHRHRRSTRSAASSSRTAARIPSALSTTPPPTSGRRSPVWHVRAARSRRSCSTARSICSAAATCARWNGTKSMTRRPTNTRSSPACAARPVRSPSSASATTWASRWWTGKSTPSPAAWTPTTSTQRSTPSTIPRPTAGRFRAPLPTARSGRLGGLYRRQDRRVRRRSHRQGVRHQRGLRSEDRLLGSD